MKLITFSVNRDEEMRMGNNFSVFAFVSQLQELIAKVTIRRDWSQRKDQRSL